MTTTANEFELIVIGSGPAGYSAAIRAAQLGGRVLLVEKGNPGGTCLNRGCVPTKFLWEASHLHKSIKRSGDLGITAEIKEFPFAALRQKKDRTVDLLSKSLKRLIEGYGITAAAGAAHFTGTKSIAVVAEDQTAAEYRGTKIIIATGSSPCSFPALPIDHEKVIDSTDALNLAEVPKKFLIIGGGAIGVEMATFYAGMGSDVTLMEKEHQLLPGEDAELAAEIQKTLVRQNIKVLIGTSDYLTLMADADKVLVVTGRKPNCEGLSLESASIPYSKKGIAVNDYLETTQNGIYAAGDVNGNCYLAYTAQMEGIIAAENAMGRKTAVEYQAIPRVVFGQPAAASVGAKEAELIGKDIVTGRFPFTANSRAFIGGERTGWVKVLADAATGAIIGGRIYGPSAAELITVFSLAIKHGLTLDDMRRECFFHPSLSEAIYGACEDALAKCVDLPKKV